MKILHIINNLGSGGAEKLIDESVSIMNQFENIDIEVLLLSDKDNVFDRKLKEHNIKVDVIPLRKIYNYRNIMYIRNYIVKGNYDIVHSHLFPCNYWTSMASKFIFRNKPNFITTEHSTHNRRRDKFYYRPIEKFIYSSYDMVISISQETQINLKNWLKLKDEYLSKFIVIDNGINLKDFVEASRYEKNEIDKEISDSTKLLCMVGSFSKQKDQATIIRAMKNLPEDICLLLVGDGPLRKEKENLVKELNLDSRVKFLGIRKDVPRIFKTSDIVIVSSHWEGFGLVAVEGMAAGKPVVASNVPGLAEVVKDAGILFEKGNSKELSDIIVELLSDNDKYNKVKEKCFKRSRNYNIYRMVHNYIKTYVKCVEGI